MNKIISLLKRGKYFAAFLFLALLPFAFEGSTLEPSNVPRFLYLQLIFLAALIYLVLNTKLKPAVPGRLVILLLTYYAFNLISASWSFNTADAIYEAQKSFLPLVILIVLSVDLQNNDREKQLIKALVLISLGYCSFAIYQLWVLPDFQFETLYAVTSFAEHKTLLASFLFMLLPFALYSSVAFAGSWKYVSLGTAIVTFLLLIFLQVRSVYLALLVATIVFCLFFWMRSNKKKILVLLLACVSIVSVLVMIQPTILKRFDLLSYASSASGNERLHIWHKTLQLIYDHPLLGVGADNWQYNFMRYGVADLPNLAHNNVTFQRPHNDLLWITSETGLIGLGLVLFIITFVGFRCYPYLKKRDLKVTLFFSVLCGVLTDALFSFPKERVTHLVLASVILSLLLKHSGEAEPLAGAKRKLVLCLAIVVTLFSILVALMRLKGEYHTLLLLKARNAEQPLGVVQNGQKAISAFYQCDPTSTPIYSYLGWAYDVLNRSDSMLFASKQAYRLSPYDYEVISNYAFALDKTGQRQEAKPLFLEALRINPSYEPARVNLAVNAYNRHSYEEALQTLSSVSNYKEKYPLYLTKILEKVNAGKK